MVARDLPQRFLELRFAMRAEEAALAMPDLVHPPERPPVAAARAVTLLLEVPQTIPEAMPEAAAVAEQLTVPDHHKLAAMVQTEL